MSKSIYSLPGPALDVEFHPSGAAIGSGNTGGCMKLYDLRTGQLQQHYAAHSGPVNKATFHPNGNFILTASQDSTMKVVSQKLWRTILNHYFKHFLSLQVLDLLEGRPVYTLKAHTGGVATVAFSIDGDFFASGGEDRQLLIWKSNFDRDDNARKTPRLLIPPGSKLKLDKKVENDDARRQREEELGEESSVEDVKEDEV